MNIWKAVKKLTVHGQRAQTAQSRAAHEPKEKVKREPPKPSELIGRLAFNPVELAVLVGRSTTYVYRQIYAGRLRPIADCGRLMISRDELQRFLSRGCEYNPQLKAKSAGEKGDAP